MYIRDTHTDTHTHTHTHTHRNELATENTWHGPRDTLSSSATISFDGRGFLWVEQLGNVVNFNVAMRTFTIITRPNNEADGLVLYAFDPQVR